LAGFALRIDGAATPTLGSELVAEPKREEAHVQPNARVESGTQPVGEKSIDFGQVTTLRGATLPLGLVGLGSLARSDDLAAEAARWDVLVSCLHEGSDQDLVSPRDVLPPATLIEFPILDQQPPASLSRQSHSSRAVAPPGTAFLIGCKAGCGGRPDAVGRVPSLSLCRPLTPQTHTVYNDWTLSLQV
jgi:hypothetical protein